MKVVALVSGGKDSCYAMMKCIQYGHEIVALANLFPSDDLVDELDSYMYQTVGHQAVINYAKCTGLPLFRRRIKGSMRYDGLSYRMTRGDEVEDMFMLLSEVRRHVPSVDAVSTGAIASDYQRLRVESVCSRLGLVSLAYLWKQDQSLLLDEMVNNGIKAILVKVASMGMDPEKHLGEDIAKLKPHLCKLKDLYGMNVCGEGGEYETLTLDCPLFTNANIILDEFEIVLHSSNPIAPVGLLRPLAFHLQTKQSLSSSVTEGSVIEINEESSFDELPCVHVGPIDVDCHTFSTWRTGRGSMFSMGCFIIDSISSGLKEDLTLILRKEELEMREHGLTWENVVYVHMYVSEMNDFGLANEVYARFITQERCRFGVPSRCTVELPLPIGVRCRTELLLASSTSPRMVLHVQSVSCWAPSCIGPYSQATLHEGVVYMAGQLGLDPPTMSLKLEGPVAELAQALSNCEAVAEAFRSSVITDTLTFTLYVDEGVDTVQREEMREKLECYFPMKSGGDAILPLFLYLRVSALPKRASVEVKPVLYHGIMSRPSLSLSSSSSFATVVQLEENAHYSGCVWKHWIDGEMCVAVGSIGTAAAISTSDGEKPILLLMRFIISLIDGTLGASGLTWDNLIVVRVYAPTKHFTSLETAGAALQTAMARHHHHHHHRQQHDIFALIPVIASGSMMSMDDLITFEFFARHSRDGLCTDSLA